MKPQWGTVLRRRMSIRCAANVVNHFQFCIWRWRYTLLFTHPIHTFCHIELHPDPTQNHLNIEIHVSRLQQQQENPN